jgi:hypothetical protein
MERFSMTARIVPSFFVLASIAFPQEAPPEVDRELREQVSGFYQNFLKDSYSPRRAEKYVAEDTKEWFYNAGKYKYESFKIGDIKYSDNFTTAIVTVIGKQEKMIAGNLLMLDMPQVTRWKIENGKWCWTYNPDDYPPTPFGGKAPPREAAGTGAVIPKDVSPAAIRSAGAAVLESQTMGLDKSQVKMRVDQVGSAQLVFTNAANGEIQIALDGPVVRGLTAKLDKMTVPAHGTATVSFHYDPADTNAPKDAWVPKGTIPFRIIAAPFNRIFQLDVQFVPAQ